MPPANPVPDWLQIAVAWASVSGSISVLVAVAAFWVQWFRGRDERKERKLQLETLQRAENDRIAAQARRIVPEVASSVAFGESIWIGHIKNASSGAVSQLKVVVEAYDINNEMVPNGVRKATGEVNIADGVQKLMTDALLGGVTGIMGNNPIQEILRSQAYGPAQQASMQDAYKTAIANQIGPQISQKMRQAMLGQLMKNWPNSLGPGGEVSVAYRVSRPDLRLSIAIGFEDEAGYLWFRVNTDQPVQVTPEEFGAMRHDEMSAVNRSVSP